jgi:predicted PurR-regulated permease PerM
MLVRQPGKMTSPTGGPSWHAHADAWFKLLGAIVLGALIVQQVASVLRGFEVVTVIFAGGLLLAYLLYPLVRVLNEHLPLWASLLAVYAGLAIVFALAGWFVLPNAIAQLTELARNAPDLQRSFVSWPV